MVLTFHYCCYSQQLEWNPVFMWACTETARNCSWFCFWWNMPQSVDRLQNASSHPVNSGVPQTAEMVSTLLPPDNLLTSIQMNGLQQTLNQTFGTGHRIPTQTAPIPTVYTLPPAPPPPPPPPTSRESSATPRSYHTFCDCYISNNAQ